MEKNLTAVVEQTDIQNIQIELPSQTETVEDESHESEVPLILDELIIEEVNIDGMCGVY